MLEAMENMRTLLQEANNAGDGALDPEPLSAKRNDEGGIHGEDERDVDDDATILLAVRGT
jgi:hypothetical protein